MMNDFKLLKGFADKQTNEWTNEQTNKKTFVSVELLSRLKIVRKFSNFSTADATLASSHWLQLDLDAPGCYLFSDDLIFIVLSSKLGPRLCIQPMIWLIG